MKTSTLLKVFLFVLFPVLSQAKDHPLIMKPEFPIDSSVLIAVVAALYGIKILLGVVRQTATRNR